MLTAANIVVTCVLWAILLIAIVRYWRLGSDRRKQQWSNEDTDWGALYLEEQAQRIKLQKETAPIINSSTSIRSKTIAVCDNLREFVREQGPKPEIAHERGEADADYLAKSMAVLLPYKTKMGADFRIRFSVDVRRLRDEIQVKYGISEPPLEKAIELAESEFCEPKIIETICEYFWKLASKMDK